MGATLDLSSLYQKFNQYEKQLKEALKEGVGAFMQKVQEDAKANLIAHGRVRTGGLLDSIKYDVKDENGEIVGTTGTSKHYATYNELGTGIVGQLTVKDIPAALKPNLRYRQTPWTYFDMYLNQFVTTSGMKAKPYLYPAFKGNIEDVPKYIKEGYDECMKNLLKA